MNVVKFIMEIETTSTYNFVYWICRKKKISINERINTLLKKESPKVDDHATYAIGEWAKYKDREIDYLANKNKLIGALAVKTTQLFFFRQSEQINHSVDNQTIEIIAFSAMDLDDMFNISYKKLKKVLSPYKFLSSVKCILIKNSFLSIYPYNSLKQDIHSRELKLVAKLSSKFKHSKSEYIKWSIYAVATFVVFTFYKTSPVKIMFGTSTVDNPDVRMYLSLFCSGLFFLFGELIT